MILFHERGQFSAPMFEPIWSHVIYKAFPALTGRQVHNQKYFLSMYLKLHKINSFFDLNNSWYELHTKATKRVTNCTVKDEKLKKFDCFMEYVENKMNCSLVERTHRNSTTRQLCKSEKDLQNYFHIMMSIYQKESEHINTEAFQHCSKAKISFTIVIPGYIGH